MTPGDRSASTPAVEGRGGVSFIIIAYNEEASIRRSIQSILAQDAPHEVILVDNASTDETVARVSDLPVRIVTEPRRRRGAARNRGLAEAREDYIAFVDADVELPPGWARAAIDLLKQHPGVAGVGGPGRTSGGSWVSKALDTLQYGHGPEDTSRIVPSLATMDVLYRAGVVRHEKFHEFWAAEDPEFSFRLAGKGHRLLWSRDLAVIHHHPESLAGLIRKAFRYGMWFPAPYLHHPEQITADVLLRLVYVPAALLIALAAVFWRPAWLFLLAWILVPPAAYTAVAAREWRRLGGAGSLRFVLVHSLRQYAQMAGVWAGVVAGTWREFGLGRRTEPASL